MMMTFLKFSYDKLDEEAKSLFLLCSVFREDEDIHTESLARLAIGGGLFGEDCRNYEEARRRVVRSKNKLLDSCLLLEAGQRSVKMHDFARDAAQWIANKEIQTRKVYDKNQKEMLEREKNIKYLLCEGKPEEVFSCKFDGSKVEILIVIIDTTCDFCDRVIVPDSFFENNVSFRVFHLRSDTLFRDISLPQSMQQLKNIRSLIFTSCKLGDIYIFGNLQSLEELDLVHCQINEMPNGITELEKFRLLKMERCSIDRNNPFEVIKRCSSLQELYFVNCQSIFLGEVSFPKLQRFHVSDSEIDSSLSKYVSIEWRKELFLSETTLKYCMQEAEVLRLTRIEGEWKNIIPDIVHMDHGMNNLVELDLSFISQLKFLIYTEDPHSQVSNVFSKLVRVHLNCMGNLEELCNSSLSVDSFKSLESLSIQNCKQLRSLSGIVNQCNLKSVSLTRCPMLISLFELSTSHNLVLLEKLEVIDCENLEYLITHERKGEIFDSSSSNPMVISALDLPALESIEVKSCDKLKYIFGQVVELGSLKYMKLDRVPNLIDIFPGCNRTMSFSISTSTSKSTTHPNPIKCSILSWTDMYCCGKKLRSTTSTKIPLIDGNQPQTNLMESNSNCLSINIWERVQCLSRQSKILCNVKKIELTDLRKIKSVFVLSIAPRMLLEVLVIRRCQELEHIIIETEDHDSTGGNNYGNVFPKLKELVVDDCVQLEYIFGHYTNDDRNHTENHLHLSSLKYVYLLELRSLVAICPKQYHTTLPVLNILVLKNCSHYVSRSVNCTTMKEFSGSREDLLALEELELTHSKIQNIFCVNEVNEQVNLNVMVCPFVNLTKMRIIGCEKLQIIFSSSILRCLPQLDELIIRDCENLKHIFQDDLEFQNMSDSSSSTTCFPKLKVLAVEKCNKLKYVFRVSICNQLPELRVLIITKAKELEEIFKSSQGEGVEIVRIPNLKLVVTLGLPSLFQTQEIQFQRAEYCYRCIEDCDKLPLTSTSREFQLWLLLCICHEIPDFNYSEYLYYRLKELAETLIHYEMRESFSAEIEVKAASTDELTSPQIKLKQTQETNQEFVENVVGLVKPSVAILPTNSEASMNEQSVDQQCQIEETDATVTPSRLEGSMSEKAARTKNVSPIQLVAPKQKGIEISVEEVTTSTNVKTTTSSTRLESGLNYTSNLGDSFDFKHGIEISVEKGTTSTNSKAITSSGPIVTSEHNRTSQTPMNEQTMDQQSPLEETDATAIVTPSQLEDSMSEKAVGTKNVSPIQLVAPKQKGIEISVEESVSSYSHGSTSEKIAAATLSTISETKNESPKQKEYGNDQTTIQSFSISTKECLAMEVVDLGGSLETNQIKNLGDTSQIVEGLGSSLLVRKELEQLLSEKHLNYETLSLLTDFLVKHPSVLLKDVLLTNRYKGYAYNCLAELLKFLQTHTVLDVLGSNHSEFVGLIQDARKFSFNKDWLDGVEKRALFPDLQFSRDTMQKLLDSKKQVIKEVEEMRLKLHFFNQHMEDIKHHFEAVLASISQQEEHALETTAALSVPLGY